MIDPLAFSLDGALVLPDLSPATAGHLGPDTDDIPGPLAAALSDSRALLANAAHHGLLHLSATYPDRLRGVLDRHGRQGEAGARGLARVGLHRVAAAVECFARTLGPDPGDDAVRAWVDACLRVEVALDLCH